MNDEPTSMIGHNSGAAPAELVTEEMGRLFTRYDDRKAALLASTGRVAITDNDSIGRGGDLIAQISAVITRVEGGEDEIVEPYRQAVSVAQRRRLQYLQPLEDAKTQINAKISLFRQNQRNLAAAAALQQQQAEADLRAAAAARAAPVLEQTAMVSDPEVVPPPIREVEIALPAVIGDLGSRTGDRKVKTFTVKDPRKLPLVVLNHEKVQAAIQSVLRDLSKVQTEIKGVVIGSEVKTQVRK